MNDYSPVQRALISVYNKKEITHLAEALEKLGVVIYSTGGTLDQLQDNGINALPIEALTGSPEILKGRVKTLHPSVHGGILAEKRDDPELEQNNIVPIDLVVVNLYPFEQVASEKQVNHEQVIENIDIGGPTMIRAAAKNHQRVGVCVDPGDYGDIIDELSEYGGLTDATRTFLAKKAFNYTAQYECAISEYFANGSPKRRLDENCQVLDPMALTSMKRTLAYGENPHQKAFFLPKPGSAPELLQGKKLSYNNLGDLDAALDLAFEFERNAAVAVKHTNPCGVGVDNEMTMAFQKAYDADPVSIFGGVVAFNDTVTENLARKIASIFLDVIAAPGYENEALKILQQKGNLKVVQVEPSQIKTADARLHPIWSGYLVQQPDLQEVPFSGWKQQTPGAISEKQKNDLIMAEKVVKHAKSNAIVVVKGEQTLGIGAGQVSRISACELALASAGEKARGSALASDAFFPFPDVVELSYEYGVGTIVQPGGSKRDQDSIDKAETYGIPMFFTGIRRFKH